jgi:carbon monoxide dehydrogenase subunit G
MGEWMPGFVRVEVKTPGVTGVGLVFRESRRMYGREATEEFEVKAFEPPRRIRLFVDGTKGTMGKGAFTFDHTLEPKDGGTEVVLTGEATGMGRIGEWLGRIFLVRMMNKALEKDLDALKAWCERTAGEPGAPPGA